MGPHHEGGGGEGECVIEIVLQPANSPDTNKCDLGFFASMDSFSAPVRGFQLDDIVKHIVDTFEDYPAESLAKLDQTWHLVLHRIAECTGDSTYALPHSKEYGLSKDVAAVYDEWEAK